MLIPTYNFPGSLTVLAAFIKQLISGILLKDIIDTLYKEMVGLLLVAIVGITLV